jgi:hypothetical protein
MVLRVLVTCPEVLSDFFGVQQAQGGPLALPRPAKGQLHLVQGDHHILDSIVTYT